MNKKEYIIKYQIEHREEIRKAKREYNKRVRMAKKLGLPYEYKKSAPKRKEQRTYKPPTKQKKPKSYLDYLKEEEKKHPRGVDYKEARKKFKYSYNPRSKSLDFSYQITYNVEAL